eukprot:COSAG02_NODE_6665_length_3436_cov_157.242497_2_plen_64_part_00
MYRESVACSRIRLLEQTDAQVQGAARAGSNAHADCARIPRRRRRAARSGYANGNLKTRTRGST